VAHRVRVAGFERRGDDLVATGVVKG